MLTCFLLQEVIASNLADYFGDLLFFVAELKIFQESLRYAGLWEGKDD